MKQQLSSMLNSEITKHTHAASPINHWQTTDSALYRRMPRYWVRGQGGGHEASHTKRAIPNERAITSTISRRKGRQSMVNVRPYYAIWTYEPKRSITQVLSWTVINKSSSATTSTTRYAIWRSRGERSRSTTNRHTAYRICRIRTVHVSWYNSY